MASSFLWLSATLTLFLSLCIISSNAARTFHSAPTFPEKMYAVNLGSWLLIEPWMLPQEWVDMGGERCDDCSTCIASEFAFAEAYPDTVDKIMKKHWKSWFTQHDVDKLVELGINTVRIPLGYWIVEDLVDRSTEFYARGGLSELRRGLQQLRDAGIVVILDHHALPGVGSPNQMFAGRCTSDVQFYTPKNYHRALVWTAVMTTLTHLDPAFRSVVSIEAMNEPIMDASQTPGYGDFQKDFVKVVRTVEFALGIRTTYQTSSSSSSRAAFDSKAIEMLDKMNVTEALRTTANDKTFVPDWTNRVVRDAILDSLPILLRIGLKFDLSSIIHTVPHLGRRKKNPIVTMFQDVTWQWGDRSNPADAAIGPQMYDNHLYYVFGGVADANPEAYMTHICNLDRVERSAELGNSPLTFGEWALPTQFEASDEFLNQWADAQKLQYSASAGWIFWNFKIEISELANDFARVWSYFEGVERGYLTKDPAALHDPKVCDPWIGKPYPPPEPEPTPEPTSSEPVAEPTLSEPVADPEESTSESLPSTESASSATPTSTQE